MEIGHRETFTMKEKLLKGGDVNMTTRLRTDPFLDIYTVHEEIARGKFAVVRCCVHNSSGEKYAAKFLRKRRIGQNWKLSILREIRMLEAVVSHPRLVKLVEVFETTSEFIIVTEYCAGGELYQYLVIEDRLAERHVTRIVRQLLDGLIFLHDHDIVHLDVKLQNLLTTQPYPLGDIKLCDFGFARHIKAGEDCRDIIGTPDYVSPEVLGYESIRTSSDMWSVGVMIYIMLTGFSPFATDNKQEMFLNISQAEYDFPDDLFGDISSAAQDFISGLLVVDPTQRMTARECLTHPWLSQSFPNEVALSLGSPAGCRRALTPPSPELANPEPCKKSRCEGPEPATNVKPLMNLTEESTVACQDTETEAPIVVNHCDSPSSSQLNFTA